MCMCLYWRDDTVSTPIVLVVVQVMYVKLIVIIIILCNTTYWPLPSNQSSYRQIARYQRGVGDHRVGQ